MTFIIIGLMPLFFVAGIAWGAFIATERQKKPEFLFLDESYMVGKDLLKISWIAKRYDYEDGEVITRTYKCYRN